MNGKKGFAWLLAFGLMIGTGKMAVSAAEPEAAGTETAVKEQSAAGTETAVKEQSAAGTETAVKEQSAAGTEAASTEDYVSRIVSFTDCTGIRVTYDANACRAYRYEVEDGVLTGVTEETLDEEGRAVLKAVAFQGVVELQQPEEGEKYTSIAADLFAGNTEITYVKLPSGVSSITAGSFQGCTSLKSVYLPPTVKSIKKDAFRDCTALTRIAFPKSVVSIGEYAFSGDTKLELVYFREEPENWHSISETAFPGAEEAKDLVIRGEKGSLAEIYARRNGLPFEEKEPEV